jgi:asparagine synthase (glutamine-hydrolysing)
VSGEVPWLSASMARRARDLLAEMPYSGAVSGWALVVLEGAERTAARFGFEERHPYYDRRLVEFALSIPHFQLRRRGLMKWVVREGLAGVLPETVLARRDKAGFEWVIPGALAPLRELLPELRVVERGWVDPVVARRIFDRVVRTAEWDGIRLWSVLALETWCRTLERAAKRDTTGG